VVNSTTITATTGAHAAGVSDVLVTNTDTKVGALMRGFTFQAPQAPPTVTSIAPSTGPALGGTPVTITGSSFQAGATATLAGSSATSVVVVNSSTITAMTPAHAPGAVDVVVTNPDTQSATLTNGFTYLTVTSILPTSGSTGGGTPVTISGDGFRSGLTVAIG